MQELGKKSFKRNEEKTFNFLKETLEAFPDKDVMVPLPLITPKNFIESFMSQMGGLDMQGVLIHGQVEDIKLLKDFIKHT